MLGRRCDEASYEGRRRGSRDAVRWEERGGQEECFGSGLPLLLLLLLLGAHVVAVVLPNRRPALLPCLVVVDGRESKLHRALRRERLRHLRVPPHVRVARRLVETATGQLLEERAAGSGVEQPAGENDRGAV